MFDSPAIPDDYLKPLRRLMPYMIPSLRSDPSVMEALILYLKLGDEKLARIAIEAMNADRRLSEAALKRQQREESLLRELNEEAQENDDEDDEDDEENDNLDDDASEDD